MISKSFEFSSKHSYNSCLQKRLTHDFRTGVRKVREEGLGTGVKREVNRGLVKFKMADEIVGVKVIGIFTPTIKLLALRGRVKFSF